MATVAQHNAAISEIPRKSHTPPCPRKISDNRESRADEDAERLTERECYSGFREKAARAIRDLITSYSGDNCRFLVPRILKTREERCARACACESSRFQFTHREHRERYFAIGLYAVSGT